MAYARTRASEDAARRRLAAASRGTAVAIALLLMAALAAAGCGLGPGEGVGEVSLTVTRDYGAEPVRPPARDEVRESDTVMRLLDREAEIETRYSGDFVEAIDGLDAERRDGRFWDWLYYVNGVEATVGAADYELRGGEAVWWDYRDWSAALRVPAVVGSWPQPFRDGYEGERRETELRCRGVLAACVTVRASLLAAGAKLGGGAFGGEANPAAPGAIRVLVGPWRLLRTDAAAAQIERGPQASGVFAAFEPGPAGFELVALDEAGEEARRFGAGAGLVAATRRFDGQPVWVVTGTTAAGVRAAARLLKAAALRNRYAVAVEGDEETSLPLR